MSQLLITLTQDDKVVGQIVATERTADTPFGSGSVGFGATGQMVMLGKGFQVSINLTEQGTKGRYLKRALELVAEKAKKQKSK